MRELDDHFCTWLLNSTGPGSDTISSTDRNKRSAFCRGTSQRSVQQDPPPTWWWRSWHGTPVPRDLRLLWLGVDSWFHIKEFEDEIPRLRCKLVTGFSVLSVAFLVRPFGRGDSTKMQMIITLSGQWHTRYTHVTHTLHMNARTKQVIQIKQLKEMTISRQLHAQQVVLIHTWLLSFLSLLITWHLSLIFNLWMILRVVKSIPPLFTPLGGSWRQADVRLTSLANEENPQRFFHTVFYLEIIKMNSWI